MTENNIVSGFEYWPQKDGETFQYNIFITPARYYPDTMEILEQTGAVYNGNMLISTTHYGVGSFVSFSHHPTVADKPIDMRYAQVNGQGVYDGHVFIGEAMNELGNVIFPPEPKLALELIVGHTFDVFSTVFQSETDKSIAIPSYHTRYRTIRFTSYPNAPDVVVTALAEINPNGSPAWVGNYYYQRGVGVILQYGGVVGADGITISQAVKLFKNP